jgi:branched-chain amino acid transport system ATP-binding protein
VDDVSVSLGPQERLAVIGPNGAGKTTLFKLIAGEVRPNAGTVRFDGREVTRWSARRRARLGIARTFQVSNLFRSLTVAENVMLAAQARRKVRWSCLPAVGVGAAARETERVIEQLMLGARRNDRVENLSHGERRQLEIAMALVVEPRLLLLDEPAAGLSRAERQLLTALLLSLDRDVTLLLIEHDMDVALTVAERVTMMHDGVVIVEGTPAEIRADQRVHDLYLGKAHV